MPDKRKAKTSRKAVGPEKQDATKAEPAAVMHEAQVEATEIVSTSSSNEAQLLQMMQSVSARLGQIEANSIEAARGVDIKPTTQSCCASQCCCFDVIISRARVLKEQSGPIPIPGIDEPGDADLGPLDPLNKYMEMQFNVVAADLSALAPSLGSFLPMNRAGNYQPIGRKIGTLTVNGSRSVPVMAEAREVETSVLGGRAEHGASETSYLQLTCGCPVIPVMLQISLDTPKPVTAS